MPETDWRDRFWAKVDRRGPDDCWPWLGYIMPNGYGQFARSGESKLASHTALEIDGRPVPTGLCACHHCDNRRCVNPRHLFVGTHDDNMADCVRKGRTARGERNGQAKLSPHQVAEIRRRRSAGSPLAELAAEFGVAESVISMVARGRSWGHHAGDRVDKSDGLGPVGAVRVRRSAMLGYIASQDGGRATVATVRDGLGHVEHVVYQDLCAMARSGLLERVGRAPGRGYGWAYRITPDGLGLVHGARRKLAWRSLVLAAAEAVAS